MTLAPSLMRRSPAAAAGRHARRRRPRVGPLVVVGGQGSLAPGALHVAELLARRDRVNAHVVGLMRPVDVPGWLLAGDDAGALEDGLRRQRRAHLRRQVHAAVGRSVFFSTEVLVGRSLQTLRDAALDVGAEYVLAGLDDPNAPERIRSEQMVLQLARVMERPVLAVPRGCTTLPTRALVALCGDAGSERAARAAARVLAPGGTLTLAHVVPGPGEHALAAGQPLDHPGRGAAQRVERLAAALRAVPGITVETAILRGEPAAALLALAAGRRCDLIACGMSRDSAQRGPDGDGTLAAVLGGAAGAVLVAPPDGAAGRRDPWRVHDGRPARPPATAAAAAPAARDDHGAGYHLTHGGVP